MEHLSKLQHSTQKTAVWLCALPYYLISSQLTSVAIGLRDLSALKNLDFLSCWFCLHWPASLSLPFQATLEFCFSVTGS